jgi:hypothetical protein
LHLLLVAATLDCVSEVFVAMDDALPPEVLADCRRICTALAARLGKPISLAYVDSRTLDDLNAWTLLKTQGAGIVRLGATLPGSSNPESCYPGTP